MMNFSLQGHGLILKANILLSIIITDRNRILDITLTFIPHSIIVHGLLSSLCSILLSLLLIMLLSYLTYLFSISSLLIRHSLELEIRLISINILYPIVCFKFLSINIYILIHLIVLKQLISGFRRRLRLSRLPLFGSPLLSSLFLLQLIFLLFP